MQKIAVKVVKKEAKMKESKREREQKSKRSIYEEGKLQEIKKTGGEDCIEILREEDKRNKRKNKQESKKEIQ